MFQRAFREAIQRYCRDVAMLALVIFTSMMIALPITLWTTGKHLKNGLGQTAVVLGVIALFIAAYIPLTRPWIDYRKRRSQ